MTTYGTHDGATAGPAKSEASAPRNESDAGGSMLESLDTLGEKVEMARATVVKLREDNEELRAQCDSLRSALARYEETGTPEQIESRRAHVDRLEAERDALLQERADVADRVRHILSKVEALESVS